MPEVEVPREVLREESHAFDGNGGLEVFGDVVMQAQPHGSGIDLEWPLPGCEYPRLGDGDAPDHHPGHGCKRSGARVQRAGAGDVSVADDRQSSAAGGPGEALVACRPLAFVLEEAGMKRDRVYAGVLDQAETLGEPRLPVRRRRAQANLDGEGPDPATPKLM